MPVEQLELGMFVAELDRPWLDTSFLLEALLVRTNAELQTLRNSCRYVVVDVGRSTTAVASRLRDELARRAAGRRGGRALVGRLFEALLGRGKRRTRAADDASRPQGSADALCLPQGTTLRPYREPAPLEAELPRARESWERGAETLQTLLEDLRNGARSDLRVVEKAANDLVESMIETPDAVMWVARLRDQDKDAYQHSLKVAIHLIALGRHIGFPREDLARLSQIGMLADVGKIRLPRALLEKPGLLTPAEQAVVRRHVRFGIEALRESMKLDPMIEQGILQHHERLDGSGYPMGLRGMDIGIFGRMAGIADCFAALISDRPYAKAAAPQDALMQMYGWCGTSFHEPLVEQFVQAIGVFPVGSLVELSNDEAAIVIAHNRVRRLEPRVLVLAGADHVPLAAPFERDLIRGPVDGDGKPIRIARGLPAGAYGLQPHDYYADASAPPDGHVLAAA
ncbi:MAG: HD-GYP domain-containing protein [Burkholderiaceae bacterium]|nr:HD-GYP domain-containing protein [Burkholderiaceae bacterium]